MQKSILLLFAALLPLVTNAQTKVEIDGIWYNLVSKTKQAEVTSSDGTGYSGSITIPATITYDGAQYSVTSIGESAFSGCHSLTDITIPEGVTSIGDGVFWDCSSLTAITLPEGVTSIGNYTFIGCSRLHDITIPENSQLTSIGNYAFDGCSSLNTIVLPKSVRSVGSEAFAGCSELTDVYCYAETVPTTSANAFDGSYPEYATLHVPAINNYKTTAPWSSFGTIVTIEEVTLEKCATPTINYKDGKVVFACDTEGAIVKSSFKDNSASDYNDMEVAFIPTYTLTAYATKENYENSDEVTLTLCWIPCDENHEESDGILTIPAKPVLISTQGGTITLSGLAEGTEVAVVTTGGTAVATATATNGTATLTTGLEAGSIAIVKIGEHSIKVAIR